MLYTFQTPVTGEVPIGQLAERLQRLVAGVGVCPSASVVVPVNAQGDMENVLQLLSDLGGYSGSHIFEVMLVVNNFDPDSPPSAIDDLRQLGVHVISIPDVRRPGEAVGFSARIPGARASGTDWVILFDADCRISNPTAVLDWYVDQFRSGAKAAYTKVGFYDMRENGPNRVRMIVHYLARWAKRVVFRIPTTRGSNYAVNRELLLKLYSQGLLADEMNVGPAIKASGGRVAYSGRPELMVLTSGRMFSGRSWLGLLKYLSYRLCYNLRVLPVRPGVAHRTRRENDPMRRYVDNRPV